MRLRFLLVVLVGFSSSLSFAQTPTTGGLTVTVTRAGQPVANATVCVGVSNDRNLFFQGVTNAEGRVNTGAVPSQAWMVTARSGSGGAELSFPAAASPSGIPFQIVSVPVPASGGPSCPTTPAGPQRTIGGSINVVITPVVSPTPITLRSTNVQRCFGALGNQCGQAPLDIPLTALCARGVCFVNSGSWDHDECCFRNPLGMACQKGPLDALTGHDGSCVESWNRAVRLAGKGLNWARPVDFNRGNNTGTVEFALYCAPRDTLVRPGDGAKCCSGGTRALTQIEAALATLKGEPLAACN